MTQEVIIFYRVSLWVLHDQGGYNILHVVIIIKVIQRLSNPILFNVFRLWSDRVANGSTLYWRFMWVHFRFKISIFYFVWVIFFWTCIWTGNFSEPASEQETFLNLHLNRKLFWTCIWTGNFSVGFPAWFRIPRLSRRSFDGETFAVEFISEMRFCGWRIYT